MERALWPKAPVDAIGGDGGGLLGLYDTLTSAGAIQFGFAAVSSLRYAIN